MLKSTLRVKDDFDLDNFKKLKAYLKKQNKGSIAKKSRILFSEDITRFCNEADDQIHLARKVMLIVGVFGACRRSEIHDLTMEQVQDNNKELIFHLPKTKNDVPRSFIIGDKHLYDICKKYMALRPVDKKINLFFIYYRNGKCTVQPIGVNTISKVPFDVESSKPKIIYGSLF
ncbi:hypothetical protein HCN44_010954 [Aphidius gifuensis]|uniref:Tyr recombinase domain-containing protein n=1 Tax=Aphidius gifuensis TaxID=684658 RepID=A0A834Y4R0_APHGI|nr:hypothetical protein HCN44_010954 [Aphidius gifuensis]